MSKNSWFNNRVAALATMHKKEQVIVPILTEKLSLEVIVPTEFNTDKFGTFTRDIKRLGTQLEAAKAKAKAVLELTGYSIAIASEGSFYPYPGFPLIPCNREIVLLIDRERDLEIYGEEISPETNHSHQTISNIQQALDFAEKIGFPEHGLVAMLAQNTQDQEDIFKGINSEEKLIEIVEILLKKSAQGTVHLETDMRAMYNPTRMKVIEKATQNLIQKFQQFCPQCGFPGFAVGERIPGLPCSWCHAPTDLILAEIYHCKKCHFQQEKRFPKGIETAEPSYCPYCNP